jgi:hypothetical protein
MIRFIIIILILVSCGMPVCSQDTAEPGMLHCIGYQPGYLQIREMNLIPKVHRGMFHCISYGFEIRKRDYQVFRFAIGYANPKTSIERKSPDFNDYDKNQGQIHFNYAHLFSVPGSEKIRYYLGPMVSYTYSISNYYGWDSHAYWGNFFSLGPKFLVRADLVGDRTLQASLDFSLFGFYNRPDAIRLYKVEDWSFARIVRISNQNYKAGIFTNAFQSRFSAEYRFGGSGTCRLALIYGLYYSRIVGADSRQLVELINRVGLNIYF